ncbi:ATP-dependent 6-phosphofructokinase [Mycobacterium kiyosense]|uniref:ATP-dependent 6-phosphofructokinase n=1 Tax=Mycobacterium kiyosense TaxID=2871094 RepID=A0AA37PZ31_9MYCO|nr:MULTISPECIES: ATP-dependent 6-phosphofructokinase [Mycobacterium]GLB85093.1 ATP-dependent 6-phosphofructokinase [Mycobacterium kiyosense]GLB97602.1 ATP-dependent 6-phosphofructokinase [Mycobacterium kiyosense]GLD40626.1 ATP-dependent 6-phosphofructokinase [Mycobacterium kiyosense]
MTAVPPDFKTDDLGECKIVSPLRATRFMDTSKRLLFRSDIDELREQFRAGVDPPAFELAGPRERIYFNPGTLRCGIVTCGGLCPGLNDVIRSIVFCLHEKYGTATIYGFRFGFEGLVERSGLTPIELTARRVTQIHEVGGSVLGSSRGPQPPDEMVDTLERLGIQLLFTIGGDGTLRGAHSIVREIQRRGLDIAVVGVPKTIDNDISYIDMSFGFDTAVEAARQATRAAYVEASCHRFGIGLVKLMGRDSGFIASFATLADTQVGLCLIPEVEFSMDGVVRAAKQRIDRDGYVVIVVAEGAGQHLMAEAPELDASGNRRHGDIGASLRNKITEAFRVQGISVSLKYIDPSYMIRSLPANARDANFCLRLGHAAVHAGMAGKTDMVIGSWRRRLTHVPIPVAVSSRKKVDTNGYLWQTVLSVTGQADDLLSAL